MSTLVQRQDDYASLGHPAILEALLAALDGRSAFGWHRDGRLRIEADALARAVLKEREIKQYGEYRTGRLVLAAWDGLGGS